MRKSRVLLAGVAVAAAGVATSAFTASNTMPASVAGYGQGAVTGATVTEIHYDPNAATPTSSTPSSSPRPIRTLTGTTTTMTLKTAPGGTVLDGTPTPAP